MKNQDKLSERIEKLGLEYFFGVVEPINTGDPRERWEVIDAECVTVALCPSREMADLVADALNAIPRFWP